jgi:Glycogen recognition site of AMP-activated protein kinase
LAAGQGGGRAGARGDGAGARKGRVWAARAVALGGGLAAVALAALVNAAPRIEADAEIEAGGGHDDNLLLSPAAAETGTVVRVGGAFAAVSPALTVAAKAGGYQLALFYLGDLRAASDVGRLLWNQVELEARTPLLGPLRLALAGLAGRFNVSQFPEENFSFVGAEARARLGLSDEARLLLRYRAELRRLAATATSAAGEDLSHGGEARLAVSPWSWLELALRASLFEVTARAGDDTVAPFERARLGLDAGLAWNRITIVAGGFAGSAGLRDDRETLLGGRIDLRFALGAGFGLFAAFDTTASPARGADSAYARRVLSAGISAEAGMRLWQSTPPPETDLRPVVTGGKARFRLRAPGATNVVVVGSWDDWAAPGLVLSATREPGLWEVTSGLPPGGHRYHFVVDGAPRRPPNAPRYVADGFGDEDGVIDVPAGKGAP